MLRTVRRAAASVAVLSLAAAPVATAAGAHTTPTSTTAPATTAAGYTVTNAPPPVSEHLADLRELRQEHADRATRPAHVDAPAPAAAAAVPAAPIAAQAPPVTSDRRPKRAATTAHVVRRPATRPVAAADAGPSGPTSSAGAAVVAAALSHVGAPYVFGAAGPAAFDCSGLAMVAYAAVGVQLPHSTGGMLGRGRPVSRDALRPGDLVFPSAGHVAIYIGGGMMVAAPHSGDHVRVARVYAFYTGRRVLP